MIPLNISQEHLLISPDSFKTHYNHILRRKIFGSKLSFFTYEIALILGF